MKKTLLFFLMALIIMGTHMLMSCGDDDKDIATQEESARYYVKYEVKIQTQHINADRTISYTDEKGKHSFTNSEWMKSMEWDGTYGPVDKNFVASLSCQTAYDDNTQIYARIYVSREKEPFVVKAEGNNEKGRCSLSLYYKIDF